MVCCISNKVRLPRWLASGWLSAWQPVLLFMVHTNASLAPSMPSCSLRTTCRPRRAFQAVRAAAVMSKPRASAATGSAPNVLSIIPFAITNGIQFAKIKPEVLSGLDQRGLVATYDINSKECICSVPAKAAIRSHPGSKTALDLPPITWQQLPWFARIALLILDEVKQGSTSKFADYVRVLPQQIDVPVLWSAEELLQLHCKYFIKQVQQQQEEWAQLARQLHPHLSAAGISTDQFFWALSLARSRAFAAPYTPAPLSVAPKAALAAQVAAAVSYLASGAATAAVVEVLGLSAAGGVWLWLTQQSQTQQQHALCPLLDMFNHSGQEQSECELDVWSDSFRIVASRPWRAGQQVFISYGNSSNDVLLQLYGFVEAGNRQDRYLVRCLPEALSKLGIQTPSSTLSKPLEEVAFTRQGIPPSAAAALEQLCTQHSINDNSSSYPDTVPYSRLSQQARSVCAAAVEIEVQQLGVDLTGDEQLLQLVEQLPHKQQELLKRQQQVQQQEAQAAQLQQQLDAQQHHNLQDQQKQGRHVEHHSDTADSDRPVSAAGDTSLEAGNSADPVQQLAVTVAEKLKDLQQLQHDLLDLQLLVSDWQQRVQGCKAVAVLYRVEKRRLLDDVLGVLM